MANGGTYGSRLRPAAVGAITAGLGVGIIYVSLASGREHQPPPFPGALVFCAPTLVVVGAVVFVRGLAWGSRVLSAWTALASGLVMLVVGVFPWVYTEWLTGDRPGGESAGMLGTLLFVLVGVPGLVLTAAGVVLRWLERNW